LLDYTKQHSIPLYKVFYYLFGTIAVISIIWSLISIRSNINRIHTQAFHININGTPLWTFSEKQAWEIKEFFPKVEEDLHGEKNVFVYPYCPLIYTFINLNNPTKFDFVPVYFQNKRIVNLFEIPIINLLRGDKINYVVYCGLDLNYINSLLLDQLPNYNMNSLLDVYVIQNYNVLLRVDNIMLLKIK